MSPDSQAYEEVLSSVQTGEGKIQTLPAFADPPLHQSNQHFILVTFVFPPSSPHLVVPLGRVGESGFDIHPMVCFWWLLCPTPPSAMTHPEMSLLCSTDQEAELLG